MKNRWILSVVLTLFTWSSQVSASLILDVDGIDINYAAGAFGTPQLDPNLNVLVSDPAVEIEGNGNSDNSFAGLLFQGEFVDFFASRIVFSFLDDINGRLIISDIGPSISGITFSGAVNSVLLVSNTLEINIINGAGPGTGVIDLIFASDTATPGTELPEPDSLFLAVLALFAMGLVQFRNSRS